METTSSHTTRRPPQQTQVPSGRRDLICYAGLLYSAYCALAISRGDVFLAKSGLFPPPVVVYFGFTLAMAVAAACAARVRWSELSNSYGVILMPLLLLAAIALLQLPRSENTAEVTQQAFMPLISMLAISIAPIAMQSYETWQSWRRVLIGALLLLIASLAVDVVIPGTFSKVLSRPAGFPENPNQTAATLCMLTALLLNYRRATIGSFALLLIGGVAVMATLSRAGMVLFALIVFAFLSSAFILSRDRINVRTLGLVVVTAALAVAGVAQLVASSEAYRTAGAQRRLDIFSGERTFVRVDDPRVQIAEVAISEVELRPIAGHGPAASRLRAIAPHNLYLSLWWDYGVVALVTYIAMLSGGVLLALHKAQIGATVFFAVLAAGGLFSHTLLDARATHFGIAAAIVMCSRSRREGTSVTLLRTEVSNYPRTNVSATGRAPS
jgi:O-antigen ligase